MPEPRREAGVQYGDYTGTVAVDRGDFVTLHDTLAIPRGRYAILQLDVYAGPIGVRDETPRPTSSYTSLTATVADMDALAEQYEGAVLANALADGPVAVEEWHYEAAQLAYGEQPMDALSVILQGAKRFSLVLRFRTYEPDRHVVNVVGARHHRATGHGWEQYDPDA